MTMPWIFLIVTLISGELGLLLLCHEMRQKSETQKDLDRCSGKLAMKAKRTLEAIESSNQKILKIRSAMNLALEPKVFQALQQVLRGYVLKQEFYLGKWRVLQNLWLIPQGRCRQKSLLSPLPVMRPVSDLKGPQALRWTAGRNFQVTVRNQELNSRAEIKWQEDEEKWIVAWSLESKAKHWWRLWYGF